MRKILVIMLTAGILFLGVFLPSPDVEAASPINPTASDNLSVGLKSYSSLTATSDGYMRVFYDGSAVRIEYYDDNFNIKSKKSVAMELKIWGGFYEGSNAYYLVEGQNNTAENDSAEVIRVIKYDKNWNKLGAAKITGDSAFAHEIRYPFDSVGCVEMDEYNGTLYIVTAHEGYVDPLYNQGHTGFLMIAVDEASMTGKIVDADLWHSFAQYIEHKGSTLYVLEQSEGSGYTKLSKGDASEQKRTTSIPVLKYGGDRSGAWSVPCYASVDGMALSSDNVLCLGTSIDQSKYGTSNLPYNIYLTVTPMSNFTEDATTVKWLTSYTGSGKEFYGAKITKVNDNRFMISWEEYGSQTTGSADDPLSGFVLHYLFVDGNGNKISSEYTAKAPISDCQPVVKGSKIVYCASSSNMVNFYTIDSSSGKFSKKSYRIAGENATWDLTNGVLTISGTGAMSVDTEGSLRFSGNSGWYSSSDNCWKYTSDSVTKIVIDKGITDIPARAFVYFNNLKEVELADSVKTIGKEAFAYNNALTKITIPSGVTSIGDDILWTGSTWIGSGGHVVRATIYTYSGSKALQYAKDNDIKYVLLDESSSNPPSSSSSTSSSKPSSSSSSSKPSSSSSSSKPSGSSSSSKPSGSSSSSKPSGSTSSTKPSSSSASASSTVSSSTSVTSSDTSTPQIIPDDTSSVPDESSSESISSSESESSSSVEESSSSVQPAESGSTSGTGSGTTGYGESEPDSSDNSKPWVIPVAVGGGAAVVGAGVAVTVVTIKKRKKW